MLADPPMPSIIAMCKATCQAPSCANSKFSIKISYGTVGLWSVCGFTRTPWSERRVSYMLMFTSLHSKITTHDLQDQKWKGIQLRAAAWPRGPRLGSWLFYDQALPIGFSRQVAIVLSSQNNRAKMLVTGTPTFLTVHTYRPTSPDLYLYRRFSALL